MLTLLYFLLGILGGVMMSDAVRRFLPLRAHPAARLALYFLLSIIMAMPIWVGDENPLYLLPFYLLVMLCASKGARLQRLTVSLIFYPLLISVSMMLDSLRVWFSLGEFFDGRITILPKLVFWVLIWLFARRIAPDSRPISLSLRLWTLVGVLSLAPLFAQFCFVFYNTRDYDISVLSWFVERMAYTVLPFVLLSTLALLFVIAELSRNEALAREHQLAELRALYYEGLQNEQRQVRTLRHDLANHVTALRGLLQSGDTSHALRYLSEMADSPALSGGARLCENEAANAVLSQKAALMRDMGLLCEFSVSLPAELPLADSDLCALLGNAVDNAIEGARQAGDKRILVRARADKGVLMLRVQNAVSAPPEVRGGALQTTKEDKTRHGFGVAGMREIAVRYGGTFEAGAKGGRFELIACIPI